MAILYHLVTFALAVLLAQKASRPAMSEEELKEFLKGVTACAATELHGRKRW